LSYADMKDKVVSELKRVFRPELLNRIDDTIVFHELTHDEIKQIIDLMIGKLEDRLRDQQLRIDLSDAAKNVLGEEGYDPASGARPLRRAIQRLVEDPLSEGILAGKFKAGDLIQVGAKDGRLTFSVKRRKETKVGASVGNKD